MSPYLGHPDRHHHRRRRSRLSSPVRPRLPPQSRCRRGSAQARRHGTREKSGRRSKESSRLPHKERPDNCAERTHHGSAGRGGHGQHHMDRRAHGGCMVKREQAAVGVGSVGWCDGVRSGTHVCSYHKRPMAFFQGWLLDRLPGEATPQG